MVKVEEMQPTVSHQACNENCTQQQAELEALSAIYAKELTKTANGWFVSLPLVEGALSSQCVFEFVRHREGA